MLRATSVKPARSWHETPADTVVLEFDDRHRRRMSMTGTRGLQFLLDLPEAVALRGGDALVLDDNRLVEVIAAAEPLIEIRSLDPAQLIRIAWHLGNRHLPTQLAGKHLRIRRDHVIEDMVKRLGAKLLEIEAPFDPEGGAYVEADPAHGNSHGHDHQHDHRQAHRHADHDHGHHDHSHDHHGDHTHDHDHGHHDHGHRHDGR